MSVRRDRLHSVNRETQIEWKTKEVDLCPLRNVYQTSAWTLPVAQSKGQEQHLESLLWLLLPE